MEQINPQPNLPTQPQIPATPRISLLSSSKPVLIILSVIFLVILSSLTTYLLVKSQTPFQMPITSSSPIPSIFSTITPEQICQRSNYEQVEQCGNYFIASRPCCDQPSDILDSSGKELATCGGPPPPQSPQCAKYEQQLKTIDLSSCPIITCPK